MADCYEVINAYSRDEQQVDLPFIRDLIAKRPLGITPLDARGASTQRNGDAALFSDEVAKLGRRESASMSDCYGPFATPRKPSLAGRHRLWTGKPLERRERESGSMAECYQAVGLCGGEPGEDLGARDAALVRDLIATPRKGVTPLYRDDAPRSRSRDAVLFEN